MLKFIYHRPSFGGLLVGLAISTPHFFLPLEWSVAVAALTLVFIAGIYVGFAIINGREQAFLAETFIAITFAALGLGGLFLSIWIIPLGLVGHAIWDFLHYHETTILTELPGWYIPFCIVVDIVLAVLLTISWV